MDNEYYLNDRWTEHENGCWSINRKGVMHLVVKFSNDIWGAYRNALPYEVDPEGRYLDGYLDSDRKVVCGAGVAMAIGIPSRAQLNSVDAAKQLCDQDWNALWDEIPYFDKWYFFGSKAAKSPLCW